MVLQKFFLVLTDTHKYDDTYHSDSVTDSLSLSLCAGDELIDCLLPLYFCIVLSHCC